MTLYKFKDKMFEKPYAPYFDAYKGLVFKCLRLGLDNHIFLVCVDDPFVIVDGAVHLDELDMLDPKF